MARLDIASNPHGGRQSGAEVDVGSAGLNGSLEDIDDVDDVGKFAHEGNGSGKATGDASETTTQLRRIGNRKKGRFLAHPPLGSKPLEGMEEVQ